MIIEIDEHFIETDDIEAVSAVCTDWDGEECFRVYVKSGYVKVRRIEKRDELIRVWKDGKK